MQTSGADLGCDSFCSSNRLYACLCYSWPASLTQAFDLTMKLIGITNISFDQDFIRNQLFLFDELTVLNMETALGLGGDYSKARKRTESELEYLSNKGLVTRVRPIEHLIEEKVLPEDIVARDR
jgi:hypothetical protein